MKKSEFEEYLKEKEYTLLSKEFIDLSNKLHFEDCYYLPKKRIVKFLYLDKEYSVNLVLNIL